MTSIENPTMAALAKKNKPSDSEKPADLAKAKKLEQEIVKMAQGRRLEDLEASDLKKVLAKYQEIEMVLGVAEKESASSLSAVWKNPETAVEQNIEINFEQILAEQKNFYQTHLGLELDENEIRLVWQKNYAEIKKEIEICGYDTAIIIPDNLPGEDELNQKLIEPMPDAAGTYQDGSINSGGSFAGVKNIEKGKYRILLTKGEKDMNSTQDPLLKATLNKNIFQLTSLSEKTVEAMIAQEQPLPINFEANINGQKIQISAEGLSLKEYMLFQRMYFDKNQKHLDEDGWTWLTKSLAGSRVVHASWYPDFRRLRVRAFDPGYAASLLGVRLSRSFSN